MCVTKLDGTVRYRSALTAISRNESILTADSLQRVVTVNGTRRVGTNRPMQIMVTRAICVLLRTRFHRPRLDAMGIGIRVRLRVLVCVWMIARVSLVLSLLVWCCLLLVAACWSVGVVPQRVDGQDDSVSENYAGCYTDSAPLKIGSSNVHTQAVASFLETSSFCRIEIASGSSLSPDVHDLDSDTHIFLLGYVRMYCV